MKITQEVADRVALFVERQNAKAQFYWPDDLYTSHFFNENKHPLDNPWISIDFGHHSINVDVLIELRNEFPTAVIYVSGSDSDVSVSLHEKTYEQMDREQQDYNNQEKMRRLEEHR